MKWYKYKNAKYSWAIDCNKYIYILHDGILRTGGDPVSMWNLWQDYGAAIKKASVHFDVYIPTIMAMISIEATRMSRDQSHFDPMCVREEPGYTSDEKTPHRVSPGLMQTLISTAQFVNDSEQLFLNFDGTPEKLTRYDLFIPERSIMLGTGYIRYQIDKKEADEAGFLDDDPILLCASYNAGSVREGKNDWNLLTYGGNNRMDKFIKFYNDANWLLKEGRIG